jgi:hypothetical protein
MGWSPLALEGVVSLFALGGMALILALRRAGSAAAQPVEQPVEGAA